MRLVDAQSEIGRQFTATVDGRKLRVRLDGIVQRAERRSGGRVVMRSWLKVLPLDADTGKAEAPPFLTEAKNVGERWA